MKVKVNYSPTLSEFQELDLSLTTKRAGEWIIGRSPNSDLVLDSPDVSRLHGKLIYQGGNYYFCDLGSRNGSMINGKLAEKNQPYLLRHGDLIRIGDFVLTMKDIIPLSEQVETMARNINPSLFSNWRLTENINNANIANQPPEEVSNGENLNNANVVNEASEVVREIPSEEIYQESIEEVNEVSTEEIYQESIEYRIDLAEESNQIKDEVGIPEILSLAYQEEEEDFWQDTFIPPENTVLQLSDAIASLETPPDTTPEKTDQPTKTVNQEENVNLDISVPEAAISDISEIETPEVVSGEFPEFSEVELTVIQPRDILSELLQMVSQAPKATEPKVGEVKTPEAGQITDDTVIQLRDLAELFNGLPQIDSIENVELITEEEDLEFFEIVVDGYSPVFDDDVEALEQITQEQQQLLSELPEVASYEEDVELGIQDSELVSPISDNVETSEIANQEPDEVSEVPTQIQQDIIFTQITEEAVDATLKEEVNSVLASDPMTEIVKEFSEIEEVLANLIFQEATVSTLPKIITQKHIVLIAHESKKSELVEFVSRHQEFFWRSLTMTWPSVTEVLHQQSGIIITKLIPAATSGGYQRIGSFVNSGDILAVIFLRDFLQPQPDQAEEEEMLRICNINQVLVATNVSTAEAIVQYLKHLPE